VGIIECPGWTESGVIKKAINIRDITADYYNAIYLMEGWG